MDEEPDIYRWGFVSSLTAMIALRRFKTSNWLWTWNFSAGTNVCHGLHAGWRACSWQISFLVLQTKQKKRKYFLILGPFLLFINFISFHLDFFFIVSYFFWLVVSIKGIFRYVETTWARVQRCYVLFSLAQWNVTFRSISKLQFFTQCALPFFPML